MWSLKLQYKPVSQKIIKEYVMKLFDHALASPSIEEPVKPIQQSECLGEQLPFCFHCRIVWLPVRPVVLKTALPPFG